MYFCFNRFKKSPVLYIQQVIFGVAGENIMQCYLAKKIASGWCITDDLAAVSHLTLYSAALIVTFSDCVASDVIEKICSDYLKEMNKKTHV